MFGASLYLRILDIVAAGLYSCRLAIFIGAGLALMSALFAPVLLLPIFVILAFIVTLEIIFKLPAGSSDGDGTAGGVNADDGADGGGGGE